MVALTRKIRFFGFLLILFFLMCFFSQARAGDVTHVMSRIITHGNVGYINTTIWDWSFKNPIFYMADPEPSYIIYPKNFIGVYDYSNGPGTAIYKYAINITQSKCDYTIGLISFATVPTQTQSSTPIPNYQSASQNQQSMCLQVLNQSNSSLFNLYFGVPVPTAANVPCSAQGVSWGTGNACSGSVGGQNHGWSGTVYNGAAGATGQITATCNNGTWQWSSASCSVSLSAPSSVSATDGTLTGQIQVTWGGVSGASSYNLRYRRVGDSSWTQVNGVSSGWALSTGDYSTFEFQVQAANVLGTGPWSGSDTGYINRSCAAATLSWGPSNLCSASVGNTATGTNVPLTNGAAGVSGSATATCTNGSWSLSNTSCLANLSAPSSVSATDGTLNNAIQITWGSVQYATGYRVEQRKQGTSTWTTLTTTTATSYTWSGLYDESVFEFRVIPTNAAGDGTPSGSDTGYIRKLINPTFVSQNVPTKVAINQTFTVTQTWRNDGSETWANSTVYGTMPYAPADTSVWGSATVGFSGSTATGQTVNTTLSLKAPSTPGTYNFQRIFGKSGTAYGNPSPATNILVMGPASCSGANIDKTVVYVPADQVTVTILGASQTDSAGLRVWAAPDKSDLRTYPATLGQNGNWTASFPVSNHDIYGTIYVEAYVDNDVTDPVTCKALSVNYPNLPVPDVTLNPTLGYFTDSNGNQGFVVELNGQRFAKATIGSVPLPVKLEVLDQNGNALTSPILGLNAGATADVRTSLPSAKAWTLFQGTVKVSYQDSGPAGQGKVRTIPVSWRLPPTDPGVNISMSPTPPFTVTLSMASGYTQDNNGVFVDALEDQNGNQIATYQPTDTNGASIFSNVNYASVYNKSLVGAAKAVAPTGVTLLSDIVYRSGRKVVPVMPPASIDASDGTYEDEVRITWSPPYDGVPLRYVVYRDGIMISNGPITTTTFSDTTADRGKVYTYSVYSQVDARNSDVAPTDTGFIPACRAPRLLGAWVSSDMSTLSGVVEQWACLTSVDASGAVDGGASNPVTLNGTTVQKYLTVPLDSLDNGNHTYRLTLVSQGVTINANRYYDIPFTVSRQDNQVADVTITHKGNTAQNGLNTDSFGWFGLKIQGSSGVGFAQPAQ